MALKLKTQSHRSPFAFSRWWHLIAVIVGVSLIWETASKLGWVSAIFFPPPSKIASTLYQLIENGEIPKHLSATLQRVFFALLFGGSAGLLLGIAMGWSWRFRVLVDPFIAATHNIPKIAVFPLIMLLFGIGEFSKVFLLSLGTFFPILINTMAGVRQLSPIHFEVARNYGAGRWKQLTRVILPGSLPSILSGLRIASSTALMLSLAIELLTAQEGLGVLIWFAWQTMRTEELYASVVITASLGIIFNFIIQFLFHKLIHWEVELEV